VDDLDAALMAARRHGFLTIDVPVEALARTVHQCRRSHELARRGNIRAAFALVKRKRLVSGMPTVSIASHRP
jgi:hypothetical protein